MERNEAFFILAVALIIYTAYHFAEQIKVNTAPNPTTPPADPFRNSEQK